MAHYEPGLSFVIVGASVAGLAAAIALKSSGHTVVVLERDSKLGDASSGFNGCAKVAPNGSKILFDWGLEAEAKANSAEGLGFAFYKYYTEEGAQPDLLGINRWDDDLLAEARGGYMLFRHQALLDILYKKLDPIDEIGTETPVIADAMPRATVIFGAEVVEINCETCSATLKSGKVYVGDAIIGADGAKGIVRSTLILEEEAEPESGAPSGLAMYSAIIPKTLILQHGLADFFYDEIGSHIWMGPNRAAITCPAGDAYDLTLWVYTPDSTQDGTWTQSAEIRTTDVLGKCHPLIRKAANLAGPATCVPINKPYSLQSWVSESGRVLVLGDAAHPFPPGGTHPYSIALEDGAFIGKIFSHTTDPARVPEFFNAFQEHREPRCSRIRAVDQGYVDIMTLPEGDMQASRDAVMRANHAAGRNVLDGDLQQHLEEFCMIFGYEAVDDADEWWIKWGRFRESSSHPPERPNTLDERIPHIVPEFMSHTPDEQDDTVTEGTDSETGTN